jgi:hypothetical protein
LKDRRRRPGGECELIKIPQGNLAYIPKLTRHPSLLTRPRRIAIEKLSNLETRLGTAAETRIDEAEGQHEKIALHRHEGD